MNKKVVISLILTFWYCVITAWGQESSHVLNTSTPRGKTISILQGTIIGTYSGLSVGWLRYTGNNQTQDVWDGVGYGALIGTGVGIAASSMHWKENGDYVLSSINEAEAWGGCFGFILGSISALGNHDSKNIGTGIAWGCIIGTVVGVGAAGYEIAANKYAGNSKSKNTNCAIETRKDSGGNSFAFVMLSQQF